MTSEEPDTPSSSYPNIPEGFGDARTRIYFDADILIGQSELEMELQRRLLLGLFPPPKRVELLTTEFTRIQVAKNRSERACAQLRVLSNEKVANLASKLFSVDLPTIDSKDMHEKAYEFYLQEIIFETSGSNWRCVEYREDVVPRVFEEYGMKRGFFRDEVKKGQFADAIIFEMLRAEATDETPVIVFSRDKDFGAAEEYNDNIKHVRSWSDLIDVLGVREDIPQAEELVEAHTALIIERVKERLLEEWSKAIEKRGLVQDICPVFEVTKVEWSLKRGAIFDDWSEEGELVWEQFLIIGEMQVFVALPPVSPVFLVSRLSLISAATTSERGESEGARCDVVFSFMGRRERSQNWAEILEVEFGDGSIRFTGI